MTTQKNNFIHHLFDLIKGDKYVLLKWLGTDLSELPDHSDLDILIDPELVHKIANYIEQSPNIWKIKVEKRAGVIHYHLFFENGDFLQIDLLFEFVRKHLTYLPTSTIFENSIVVKGINTCHKATILEHVLLFNYLNKSGLPTKYYNFYLTIPLEEQISLLTAFNQKYGTSFKKLDDTTHYNSTNRAHIVQYLENQQENSLINKVFNGLNYLRAFWSTLKENKGQIITFSGVDGAGKSTIINEIKYLLGSKYRKKVIVLRHRPSLLPIISAWKYGKKQAEQRSVERLPRQGNNKSTFSSYLRFGYYYLDYLFGQFYIWAKYLLRGYTVLYDRYYFDFIVDGRRSNINIGSFLPKKLYNSILKPSLNCFLYADVATILERKQELSPAVIESLTQRYQTLFEEFSTKHDGVYLSIKNEDKPTTLYIILKHYLKLA